MMRWLILTLALTLSTEAQEPFDMAAWLAKPDLWATKADELPSSFRWLSDQRKTAQISHRAPVSLGELEVGEVTARIQTGALSSIALDLFARGDDQALSREEFLARVTQAESWLTEHTGQQATDSKTTSDSTKAQRRGWETAQSLFQLSYHFQRARKSRDKAFQGEFIRLQVVSKQSLPLKKRSAAWLKEQVQYDDSGDVWIPHLPMVDQGAKGYCVVATTERVLRYYGMNISQHELAQLAESHHDEGTSIDAMADALRGAARVFKVRLKEHYSLFGSRSLKQLVDRYNRVARREKAPMLGYEADFFTKAKPALILKSRIKHAAFGRFETDIQQAIQQGTPLLWSVQLGVFPEKESPQAKGGHMRLIIGYQAKTQEVIYTDSWGPGHAKKRLPLDQAFAMTLALSVLEPST